MTTRQDTERLLAEIDGLKDDAVALSQALIRFDSVNLPPWGNEGPCQAFVAERMEDLGMEVDTFTPDSVPGIQDHPAFLHGRDYTNRPNVVGVLKGVGGGPSIHLAAHADVVPIEEPELWVVDPFGGEVRDGQIWGRGAVDDKDGLTGMLSAVRAIRRAGYRLRGDLILSSYVDEEFAGGNGLLAIVHKGYRGDAAINCDGVGLKLWIGNSGGGPFRVLIQSRSDTPHPTMDMRRLQVAYLEALAALSKELEPSWVHASYPPGSPSILKSAPIELAVWEQGLEDWDWIGYGPLCGVKGYVTTLPGQEGEAIKARVAEVLDEAYRASNCPAIYAPRVEWTYRFMDACAVDPQTPIVRTLGKAYQQVLNKPPYVAGGVRSDFYMLALHGGIPTVSFGAGVFALEVTDGAAHQPNERIDIDGELIPYTKTLALAMLDWCGYTRP